jgi:rhodanese-related sulfurtransferase
VLDVREAIDFEAGHLVGSINIGLGGKYATWCGAVLSHAAPIVVVAEPGQEEEAVMRLGRIGFDNVAGYLDQGTAALVPHPELVRTVDRVTAVALHELLGGANPPAVLDVRTAAERAAGRLADSVWIPLNQLRDRLEEVPRDRTVAIHCEGGYRSAIAASLLAAAGRTHIMDVVGGFKAWAASDLPVEQLTGASA